MYIVSDVPPSPWTSRTSIKIRNPTSTPLKVIRGRGNSKITNQLSEWVQSKTQSTDAAERMQVEKHEKVLLYLKEEHELKTMLIQEQHARDLEIKNEKHARDLKIKNEQHAMQMEIFKLQILSLKKK